MYPSYALALTPGIARRLYAHKPEYIPSVGRSLLMSLPKNEALERDGEMPAAGMSGAPVFTLKDKKRAFVGILHAVVPLIDPRTQEPHDFGLVHTISDVNDEYDASIK